MPKLEMSRNPPERPPFSSVHRRLFLLQTTSDARWLVTAEAATEEHAFADRGLALAYAGLWAAANAPSQLVERRSDGTVATVGEYD
jgi:hypothetical protein